MSRILSLHPLTYLESVCICKPFRMQLLLNTDYESICMYSCGVRLCVPKEEQQSHDNFSFLSCNCMVSGMNLLNDITIANSISVENFVILDVV